MRTCLWLAIPILRLWPILCRAEDPTFSDAVGTLGQERSYAESGAALVKRYAPDDIEGRRLYAEAKAAFDGLIEQLLTDLAQNNDPALSPQLVVIDNRACGRERLAGRACVVVLLVEREISA